MDCINLSGEWRFEIGDTDACGFSRELTGRIRLPGTMDDAGLGPKNTKPVTLEGPYRLHDYAGPAWYQRDIEIPAAWSGQRITLFLERCRWVTTVWVDDRLIGAQDSLIAPHVYDLGLAVSPGKHRLTICVDNSVRHHLGEFVSALFGGTWGNMNGIVGRIEIATTPPVWLDAVQVYPDVDRNLARVTVRIGNATGESGRGMLTIGAQAVAVAWNSTGGLVDVEVPVDAPRWDEFAPHLTELTVALGEHRCTVRFGMRKFAARGTQFTLNNRRLFLRGTLECSVWPLTGYPPTDVPSWQRIYRIMKDYGMNHIRFHSWCPPEAAFTAADIEGILVQAEGPQANVGAGADAARDQFIEAEFQRIVDTYGNHPSFCLMTLGNEYGGSDEVLTRWLDMLIQRDPRRLYSSAACAQKTANRQWTVHADGRGIPAAATARDLRAIVAQDNRPLLGHEIGQWMYWPDSREIEKWSGVMALKNFEWVRDDLKAKGLFDLEPKFVEASGKFATLLYKEEVEVLLRTRGYGGFALLDLHDYPTQGTALIGPLNAFWVSKGFITPTAWRRFCSATVPLLRMPKRTYAADETFTAPVELAHYGPVDLVGVLPVWRIKDERGREVAAGQLPSVDVPTGTLTALGTITASITSADVPGKLTVTVELSGTEFANDWDLWVYPAQPMPQPPAGVTVCRSWAVAQAALANGEKVVLLPVAPAAPSGKFLPVFWSPVWFPDQKPNTMGLLCDPRHPMLAQFPNTGHSDWQWYPLMENSRLFDLDETPRAYRPTVQVIDNFARNQKLGVVFEASVGQGTLLVCGFDLPALAHDPATRQFCASLYSYVASSAFRPAHELSVATLDRILTGIPKTKLQALGAKVHASSCAKNFYPDSVMDGNPLTAWLPKRIGATFPHELMVEFPRPVEMTGFTYLPPHRLSQGWIKDYAVHVSADGVDWGAPIVQGTFVYAAHGRQTIRFPRTVNARWMKLVALSGLDPANPSVVVPELSVLSEE